jgi:hypothetical protein
VARELKIRLGEEKTEGKTSSADRWSNSETEENIEISQYYLE